MSERSIREERLAEKLQETVETHLSDPDFNVEALGRVLQMSQATLYRKIQALTGKNPTSFIRAYRIKRAWQLLTFPGASTISEVAKKVGFLDNSYFARCFKEQFHCLPSDIQMKRINENVINEKFLQEELAVFVFSRSEMARLPLRLSKSIIDQEFIKDLEIIMEKNFSDPGFNVEQLAKKLYISRLTLYRKILAIYGETPTGFMRSYRLKRGAELLERGSKSVLEVALDVGFSNSSYFTQCFKEKFHRLPSKYGRISN